MANDSPIVGVHLDLKGVMFKPSYIPQLLADLASQKVNCVLVEYEDIFPFEQWNLAYDASVVWSRKTLAIFLAEAARHGIEVIPLQQCLGHLEYVYRWERYAGYSEGRDYPATLSLASKKGKAQILDMLRQMIEGHPDSKYVHLGMDEARQLCTTKAVQKLGDRLTVFLAWLEELIEVCESYGKTPIIWSDMLEDHYKAGAFKSVADRVVFCSWDYGTRGETTPMSRYGGWRTRKAWLDEPETGDGPPIGAGMPFVEDLPAATKKMLKPYERGREFLAMHQADVWAKEGVKVIGGTLVRASAHLSILPDYNLIHDNIHSWGRAMSRTAGLGLIATSWARGTTFGPPNFMIDLTWPSIAETAKALGAKPKPFWPGVPAAKIDLIIRKLGRCKVDWRLESTIADELDALRPKVKDHLYEWDSLTLMTRMLSLKRQAEFVVLEVDHFQSNTRPTVVEWQRRLNDQARTLRDLEKMRRQVNRHFSKRYHGDAYEEWLRDLFDLHVQRIEQCQIICRQKQAAARKKYAAKKQSSAKK